MIVKLYGTGFRPESVVVAGIIGQALERELPRTVLSSKMIEIDINPDDWPEDSLIYVSVLQTPLGVRSSTVTLNPHLRPIVPPEPPEAVDVTPAAATLAHTADTPALTATPPAATGPVITGHSPSPINARPQALYVTFSGTGFVNGCTFALTGPSGAQNGTCTNVQPTSARTNFNPIAEGSHQMVITNPAPGGPSAAYTFQIMPALVVTDMPVEEPPPE